MPEPDTGGRPVPGFEEALKLCRDCGCVNCVCPDMTPDDEDLLRYVEEGNFGGGPDA